MSSLCAKRKNREPGRIGASHEHPSVWHAGHPARKNTARLPLCAQAWHPEGMKVKGPLSSPPARPNPSLELTRYGRQRLAAPGAGAHCPCAASRRLPPRAAQLQR
jgi:hypothetical protein